MSVKHFLRLIGLGRRDQTSGKYFLRLIGLAPRDQTYIGAPDNQPSAGRASIVPTSEGSSDDQSGVRLSSETDDSRGASLVQRTTSQTSNRSFDIDPNSVIKKHSFPDASGGLGDVYKCSLNRNASLEEVRYTPSSL
ncbi:hypothetical protein AZE42_10004 [Rhizopogon vesiculosus]|uniref:Uncharacterized protein n=1 Tax=Rhizopogon vesiculosus TaxID=180088 RepID=A0A1J8RH74_9AGAM|nr:hypothetical protein AZE42_10004 [Rhizopogon vesiculosus]